jgi:hypothetical protein
MVITEVQALERECTSELFFPGETNQMAEKQTDRSQVIPAGFADRVPVSLRIEAGCRRVVV